MEAGHRLVPGGVDNVDHAVPRLLQSVVHDRLSQHTISSRIFTRLGMDAKMLAEPTDMRVSCAVVKACLQIISHPNVCVDATDSLMETMNENSASG